MGNVYAGYRGLADIGGVGQVRFSDASISAKQTVNAPDLVMGDWDHDAYNYGPIEVGGSINGPVTETFISGSGGGTGIWNWGIQRTGDCGLLSSADTTLYYYCGGTEYRARKFVNMLVNSVGFSCAAGDVAQFTLDIMGSGLDPADHGWINTDPPHFTTAEKLITWDKVGVAITPSAGNPGGAEFTPPTNIAYSNFDFSIANNLQVVYSLGQPNLFPFEIVPGLRTITGTLSVYNTPRADGYETWDDYIAAGVSTITFSIASLSIDMKVRFHRIEPASGAGPIISSIGFTGVSHQTGTAWEA
jgi:hypothetical protein